MYNKDGMAPTAMVICRVILHDVENFWHRTVAPPDGRTNLGVILVNCNIELIVWSFVSVTIFLSSLLFSLIVHGLLLFLFQKEDCVVFLRDGVE